MVRAAASGAKELGSSRHSPSYFSHCGFRESTSTSTSASTPMESRYTLSVSCTANHARVPMEIDELDANVIVVDDDLQAEWLKLVPGQQALPEAAPWQGLLLLIDRLLYPGEWPPLTVTKW